MAPSDRPSPLLTLRIIHAALLAGPLFIVAAMGFAFGGRATLSSLSGLVGYLIYAGCAAGLALGYWWRTRIPARRSDEGEWDYWRAALPRALMLWAVLEGVVVVGGVIGILAGQAVPVVVLLVIYLGLMLHSSPARMAGDA
jgi:hypothetical protein